MDDSSPASLIANASRAAGSAPADAERIDGVACRFDCGQEFRAAAPARHDTVLKMALCEGLMHPDPLVGQGFYTSRGRFLGRADAIEVAKASGQIVEPKWPPYLYSEDMW